MVLPFLSQDNSVMGESMPGQGSSTSHEAGAHGTRL